MNDSLHARLWSILGVALALVVAGCSDPEPVDRTESGALEEGDEVLEDDDSLYDPYTFEAKKGWNVALQMSSTDFDPYLLLVGPDGEKVDENDDLSPDDPTARIQTTAPADGTYTIVANSFDKGMTGSYELRIQVGPAAANE